ncbi:MAG: hypothetical protein ACERKY_12615 [Anaerolineales bacterium]
MKQMFLVLSFVCVLAASCTSLREGDEPIVESTRTADGQEATPTVVPTPEPTVETLQLAVYPPETRTGIVELDRIIDAVLAHDAEELQSLTRYMLIGCTHTMGLGGPPKCEPDEEEGTLVESIPVLGVEGYHQRREDFEGWQGPDVLGLLTVYRVSSQAYSDEAYPAGEYALAFLDVKGISDITLQVTDGNVVRFDHGFPGSLQSDLERDADEVLLVLTLNPIPTAVPWIPFEDPDGRFSFVYPPTMTLSAGNQSDEGRLGDQIEFFIRKPGASYVTCFDEALGDCPVVEEDGIVEIDGREVRRVKGWFGAVGGMTPQEFLTYIFDMEGDQLVFTVYALPFDTEVQDITTVWPLEGMTLELFQRTVSGVDINK